MDTKTEVLQKELNSIKKRLDSMVERYGSSFEFMFLATVFNSEKKYEFSVEGVKIVNSGNYSLYREIMDRYELRHRERLRFKHLIKIGEFRVVCVDDNISHENEEIFTEGHGDWLKRGETYVVIGVKDAVVEGGLVFNLRNLDGEILHSPYPFLGYNSTRFVPDDYTQLN